MQHSLQQRVWLTTAFSLLAFVLFIGLSVDRAYRETLQTGLQQQLEARLYALMGGVEFAGTTLQVDLPDPSLSSPASPICAWIQQEGTIFWQAPACLGKALAHPPPSRPGDPGFALLDVENHPLWVQWLQVDWEREGGGSQPLLFVVQHEQGPIEDRLRAFRKTLLLGLVLAGLVLLLMQWLALRWLLRPVHQLEREVQAVEQGLQESVSHQYPRELNTLAQALNALIHTGQAQMQRYRNALADLAHSLKTPLQVIRASLQEIDNAALQQRLEESLARMDTLVRWQLQRASTAGGSKARGRIALYPLLQSLVSAMNKLFGRQGIEVESRVELDMTIQADEGDLQELLGNLLENACKWARSRVVVSATRKGRQISIQVDDDGPGFPGETRDQLLQRGMRADEQREGQGIGLSLVQEIVRAYGGRLLLLDSPLGGARVRVELPQI